MKIIFVCTGNTCRSPFAEGYFNSLNIKGITALSRGLSGNSNPVSENSKAIANEFGFDISSHTSKVFSREDLSADYIFTMSKSHKDILVGFGAEENKVFVLKNGIFDPFGGDLNTYRTALKSIADGIDRLYFDGFFDSIKLVPFNENHIPQIAQTEKENFSEPWSETSIKESSMNNTEFFVAGQNGVFAGYVGLNHIADEGYITSIAVKENYRNKGIATKLLNKCFSFARDNGLSFVSLEVRLSNENAQSLYKKLGFKKEGLRRGFYRKPSEDAVIMTRRFNI